MKKRKSIKNIKELAQLAGVSVGSTSMVMSGKWEKKVRPEIARKILKIAEKHHYKVNPLGRSLHLKQYLRIALIMEGTFIEHPTLGALSFHEFLGVAADKLNIHGYSIDIIQLTRKKINQMIENGFIPGNNDAMIFVEWNSTTLKKLLKNSPPKNPFIVIGDDLNMPELNYVCRATEDMSYNAVNHFIKNDHKKIAICRTCGAMNKFKPKLAGYKRALYEAGIKFDRRFVIDIDKPYPSLSGGREILQKASNCSEKPTAFFCDDNVDAAGILIELEKKGLKVPGDIEIIGYGDPAVADMATKPLSYLKIPTEEMAEFAVKYILDIVMRSKKTLPVRKRFEEKLVLQETTR